MNTAKRALLISILILGIMAYVYLTNFLITEWRTWDREFREFIPIAGLAGISLFLMAVRNVEGANKHLLMSMEVLITVSIPSIAGLEFLLKTEDAKLLFPVGIAIFSVVWLIYFGFKRGKNDEEQSEIDKARFQIILMFIVLLGFSLIAFASIETFQDLLKYDAKGTP